MSFFFVTYVTNPLPPRRSATGRGYPRVAFAALRVCVSLGHEGKKLLIDILILGGKSGEGIFSHQQSSGFASRPASISCYSKKNTKFQRKTVQFK